MPIRRRSRQQGHDSLVASAFIDLNDDVARAYLRTTRKKGRSAGARPWKWYQSIPEVHYGVSRSARIAGYARLKPHLANADGSPGAAADDPVVLEAVRAIYSPFGGTRQLVARYYTLAKVPGEMHLIRCRDDQGSPDGYDFISSDELDVDDIDQGRLWRNTLPAGAGVSSADRSLTRIPIDPDDYICRVWVPSAQYVDLTDSPLSAADALCSQLDLLTKSTIARLKSRLAQAGVMLIPTELVAADTRSPEERARAYDPDPLVDRIYSAWVKAIRSNDDPSSVVPHILRGPAAALEQVRLLFSDREIMATDMQLRGELINRILMGLDSQQDAVKGVGENTNHWGAWAASDEERRVAVMPDLETMAWVLTRGVFHEQLREAGVANWQDYMLYPDLSAASSRSNQSEDGRQLHDRGAMSDKALRRVSGINDSDAPDDAEFVRWVGRQTKNPYLMLFGTKAGGTEGDSEVDWDEAARWTGKTGPAPDSPADESPIGPGVKDPGSPDSNDSDTPKSQRPA